MPGYWGELEKWDTPSLTFTNTDGERYEVKPIDLSPAVTSMTADTLPLTQYQQLKEPLQQLQENADRANVWRVMVEAHRGLHLHLKDNWILYFPRAFDDSSEAASPSGFRFLIYARRRTGLEHNCFEIYGEYFQEEWWDEYIEICAKRITNYTTSISFTPNLVLLDEKPEATDERTA